MTPNLRVLFVNPNRYRHPPVPPLGLELLTAVVREQGGSARLLDLCFAADPAEQLRKELELSRPEVVGFTVRNVDSVLFPGTEFFLPDIRDLVRIARHEYRCLTVAGGAGVGADPSAIRDFLQTDVVVEGPGEEPTLALLQRPADFRGSRAVLKGTAIPSSLNRDLSCAAYRPYLEAGGITGFRTHSGCSGNCIYCLEAQTPVSFRAREDVLRELKVLANSELTHLHLCDPEFNEQTDYCVDLLDLMVRENLGLKWALYMRPGFFSARMFEQLGRSGAYLVTLSVCSWKREDQYWTELGEMVRLGRDAGIRMVFDLLTGFPHERPDDLPRGLDRVRQAGPDEAVVNVHLRLYKPLPVTGLVIRDSSLHKHVTGTLVGPLLEPAFYHHVSPESLEAAIAGDPLFRVCGETKGVNYETA